LLSSFELRSGPACAEDEEQPLFAIEQIDVSSADRERNHPLFPDPTDAENNGIIAFFERNSAQPEIWQGRRNSP
jgi:hypothetical protein